MTSIKKTADEIKNKSFFHIPTWQAPSIELFENRATRFEKLAHENKTEWSAYLHLLAQVAHIQQQLLEDMTAINIPVMKQTKASTDKLLDESLIIENQDVSMTLLHCFENGLQEHVSPTSKLVLHELISMNAQEWLALCCRVYQEKANIADNDYLIWVNAVLEILYTKAALSFTEDDIPNVADKTFCPCCGADAVGSIVLNAGKLDGVRYLQCHLCNGRWHYIRARCTFCDAAKGLTLQSIEGINTGVLSGVFAECCDTCHGYRKLYRLSKQVDADAVADDLASLELDMLVADEGYVRGGINPFLIAEKIKNH